MMALVRTVAPADEPITVGEAKLNLHLQQDLEDGRIASLIKAARIAVEKETKRALLSQQWRLELDGFPPFGPAEFRGAVDRGRLGLRLDPDLIIRLPKPPLVSVQTVKYYAADGTDTTLDAAKYIVDTAKEPGRIVLVEGESWPTTKPRPGAVRIAFTCGWATPAEVTETLRQAVHVLVAHWYEHRTPVVLGTIATPIPDTVDMLLEDERVPEFG